MIVYYRFSQSGVQHITYSLGVDTAIMKPRIFLAQPEESYMNLLAFFIYCQLYRYFFPGSKSTIQFL